MKYLVDTNIFNKLADGCLRCDELPQGAELVATYVQLKEIERTRNEPRRRHLLATFSNLEPTMSPTSSTAWNMTPWNQGGWGAGDKIDEINAHLERLKPGDRGNVGDALIGATAVQKGFGLITADQSFAEVMCGRIANVVTIAL